MGAGVPVSFIALSLLGADCTTMIGSRLAGGRAVKSSTEGLQPMPEEGCGGVYVSGPITGIFPSILVQDFRNVAASPAFTINEFRQNVDHGSEMLASIEAGHSCHELCSDFLCGQRTWSVPGSG